MYAFILTSFGFYYFFLKNNFAQPNFYHHAKCNPNVDIKTEVLEFSPDDYSSLSIYVSGTTHANVEFKRTEGKDFKIKSHLKSSSKKFKNVYTHGNDGAIKWGYEGPSIFSNHGQCSDVKIVVEIPEKLDVYDSISITAPCGSIENDLKGLKLNEYNLRLHAGNITLNEQTINRFTGAVHIGKINIKNLKSTYTYLASSHGDISVSDSTVFELHANSINGNTEVSVGDSEYVSSNTFNGNINIYLKSIDKYFNNKLKVTGKTVNGNSKIVIPNKFEGGFKAATINGKTEVSSKEELHFQNNLQKYKSGYKGPHRQLGEITAKTVNGNSVISFQ